MRVLVVGGTGFIGTTLCAALNRPGLDVTAMARNPRRNHLPRSVSHATGHLP